MTFQYKLSLGKYHKAWMKEYAKRLEEVYGTSNKYIAGMIDILHSMIDNEQHDWLKDLIKESKHWKSLK